MHPVDVIDCDGAASTEEDDENGKADRGLGSSDGQDEHRQHLTREVPEIGRKGDQVDVDAQEDELDRHQHQDDVAAIEEDAKHAEPDKDKIREDAAKDPSKALTPDQAARIAASYTNDLFGGLNWRRVAEDSKSYLGRQMGQAMLNPGARRVLGILMFAPDWTVSTTRAAVKAFGKPDFLAPKTLAGLHQQYLIRSAMYYLLVGDAINYSMSGHHLWENKDPTVLDMDPKGERHMQWSKHTMEPVHWVTKPRQQAINKLGMLPREAIEQFEQVEYLSAKGRMPPMKDPVKHLAKNFLPISAQQSDQGGAGSVVAGFAGVPIYGKTAAEKKKEREERARKKKRK